MRTGDVKSLVREVLNTLPKPYSEHIIDEVFSAIERNANWRRRYESQCDALGKAVVNTSGGYWIADALGKLGERQVPSKKSSLIGSYSLLDTDAKTVTRKPKESEALQLMADYYKEHKAELPWDIHKHRDLLVELLMEGMCPAEAFQMVLGTCYESWPG
ncbi:hypothetical protein [Cupriavidus necator]